MIRQPTALGPHFNELNKARARLPLIILVAVGVTPLAGVRSVAVWVAYTVFTILYGLWALRLTGLYATDHRLGLMLCLTDTALLVPLLVWMDPALGRVLLLLACGAGWAYSLVARRVARRRPALQRRAQPSGQSLFAGSPDNRVTGRRTVVGRRPQENEVPLERAVRDRLSLFASTGARFAVVMLRVLRLEEAAAYYGPSAAERMLHAVARRGLRLLGPDAQHFYLPGGRVAFVFQTDSPLQRGAMQQDAGCTRWHQAVGDEPLAEADLPQWSQPYDIEGLAMAVGRKSCEHLVDGHRVECVVGWASAPADGLTADDLLYVAETGAQSTEAFRRVGGPVGVRERVRAAAG